MKVTIRSKKAFDVSSSEMNNFIADISSCMNRLKRYGVEVEATFKMEK